MINKGNKGSRYLVVYDPRELPKMKELTERLHKIDCDFWGEQERNTEPIEGYFPEVGE